MLLSIGNDIRQNISGPSSNAGILSLRVGNLNKTVACLRSSWIDSTIGSRQPGPNLHVQLCFSASSRLTFCKQAKWVMTYEWLFPRPTTDHLATSLQIDQKIQIFPDSIEHRAASVWVKIDPKLFWSVNNTKLICLSRINSYLNG